MTTKMPKKGNYEKMREQLFELEIKPLAEALAAKCKEYNFPMYANILIDDSNNKTVTNVSIVLGEEMPNRMQLCAVLTKEPKIVSAIVDMLSGALSFNDKIKKLGMSIDVVGGSDHEPQP